MSDLSPTTLPDGVAVYGSSSAHIDKAYLNAARRMGELIAREGLVTVCGGGRAGIMAAAIEGAIEAGGEAIGVLPEFMIAKGWAHPALTDVRSTSGMHPRKALMASLSRAVVAMAGGIGTLDELAEMMTWRQLGLFKGQVIIVNTRGFYDPLLAMFSRMTAEGFMRDGGRLPASVVDTPDEAIHLICSCDDGR